MNAQPETPVSTEPNLDNIQGVGLAGFRKDHQELLFVRFSGAKKARRLLAHLVPTVARHSEVKIFNELFSEIRGRGGEAEDAGTVQATWLALALSAAGLAELEVDLAGLPEGEGKDAFAAGMASRSAQIGDTREADAPTGWEHAFRPDGKPIHALLVVAADNGDDLDRRIKQLRERIDDADCEVVFSERGHALRGAAHAQEHFGFRDGISQPSVHGVDPEPAAGEPPAIALGEFVLGYPDESGQAVAAGEVFKDGSFLVFRRLQQHVFAFRQLTEGGVPGAEPALSSGQVGAKLIGRWPSGTPTATSPESDPGDSGATNAFGYGDDPDGKKTPRFAHIRKVDPRDATLPDPGEEVARHRMIRRGIPFGEPLPKGATAEDDRKRGLHFISIVSDVSRQFEFVQRQWRMIRTSRTAASPRGKTKVTSRTRENLPTAPTLSSVSMTRAPRTHSIRTLPTRSPCRRSWSTSLPASISSPRRSAPWPTSPRGRSSGGRRARRSRSRARRRNRRGA